MQIANQLVNALMNELDEDRTLAKIDKLIQSLDDHFVYEENIMKEIEFYDCKAHMDTHRRLLIKAQ